MSILKILPNAIDSTENYVFNIVTANSLTVGGTNVQSVLIINQGIDATQNTRLGSIETINTDQNTAISIIQGVNDGQNTTITAVNQFAQAAYNQANTGGGGTLDQFARDKANSANVLAQAAFDKANTVVTGGTTVITGGQYVDYGLVSMTPAPILFDYGTL
jgi:hypothetical protein